MRTVQTLIDECVKLCGGQSGLARRIGMYPADVQRMQTGKRPISGATVGLLCDLLELDAPEAQHLLAEATVAAAPAEKQGVLRRAFFACSAIVVTYGLAAMTMSGDARSMTVSAPRTKAGEIATTEGYPSVDKTFIVETFYTLSYFVCAMIRGLLGAGTRNSLLKARSLPLGAA